MMDDKKVMFIVAKLDGRRHVKLYRSMEIRTDDGYGNLCVFRRLVARSSKLPMGSSVLRVGKRFKLIELEVLLSDEAIDALFQMNHQLRTN